MATVKACAAELRGGASSRDPRLEVLYSGRQVNVELRWRRDVLWSGIWNLEVSRDGRRAEPTSDWEETIRVSDDRVDYLELASQFDGGLCVERQILLARKDRFLFLADVVVAPDPAKPADIARFQDGPRRPVGNALRGVPRIATEAAPPRPGTPRRAFPTDDCPGIGQCHLAYRGRLPLSPATRFDGAEESREAFLAARRRWGRVLPLALPEWRRESSSGSLEQTEHGLELFQSSQGRAMFAPLLVDLDPRRFRRPLTWRRLTVAENLVAQPADVAVGYRVQIGRQQWLIYRSLAAKANRTLLGHNLSTEMLVARFQRSGEVDPLLEIE